MIRKFGLLGMAVSIALLTACGSSYDSEIDEVIEAENEQLDKPSTEADISTLEREDAKIWVYEDGEYIQIAYVIRGTKEINDPVYKYDGEKKQYVRYTDGDFSSGEVDDLEADYTENVDDS